jgi:hypothetical protein
VIAAGADVPALTRLDDADVSVVGLRMGGLTVHASLPPPWPARLAAAAAAGVVDFSGYYRLGPAARFLAPGGGPPGGGKTVAPAVSQAGSAARAWLGAVWSEWPWLEGLDPAVFMVHGCEGAFCPADEGGLLGSASMLVAGSWLVHQPVLSVARRPLENPLAVLVCAGNAAFQVLADQVGREVKYPHGTVIVGARPPGRGGVARLSVGLLGPADGRDAEFGSAWPQGGAGYRVRWEMGRRFASSPQIWLAERSASLGSVAPTGLLPTLFGGGRLRGLSYHGQRDRASRSRAMGAPVLGTGYVAWTPNDAYQPGTPAGPAARPWHSQDLGELPFDPAQVVLVTGNFDPAGGRFEVTYGGVSYWETPDGYAGHLRRGLAHAAAAWGWTPQRVVLLTDFAQVPAAALDQVARESGAELITPNAPAALFLDDGPGHSSSQARIALLPDPQTGAAAVPQWTSTTSAGISARLLPAAVWQAGMMKPADAALRRPIRYPDHVTTGQRPAGPGRPGRAGVRPQVTSEHQRAEPAPGLERRGALTREACKQQEKLLPGRAGRLPGSGLEALAGEVAESVRGRWPGGLGGGRDDGRQLADCLDLLEGLAGRWYPGAGGVLPGGARPAATADDMVVERRADARRRLVPGPGWRPVTSWEALAGAVRAAGPGASALVLWQPPREAIGHAFAFHRQASGDPDGHWVDPQKPAGQRVTARPPGYPAVGALAVVLDPAGRVLPHALTPVTESASLAHLMAPARARRDYGADNDPGQGYGQQSLPSYPAGQPSGAAQPQWATTASPPSRTVSQTAYRRLGLAQAAIDYARYMAGATGNQMADLVNTEWNSNMRYEVARNDSFWNLSRLRGRNVNFYTLTAAQAALVSGGACTEYATLAFEYLRTHAPGDRVRIVEHPDVDHDSVIIGDDSDPDSELVVADPWADGAKAVLWDDYFAHTSRQGLRFSRGPEANSRGVDWVMSHITLNRAGQIVSEWSLADLASRAARLGSDLRDHFGFDGQDILAGLDRVAESDISNIASWSRRKLHLWCASQVDSAIVARVLEDGPLAAEELRDAMEAEKAEGGLTWVWDYTPVTASGRDFVYIPAATGSGLSPTAESGS